VAIRYVVTVMAVVIHSVVVSESNQKKEDIARDCCRDSLTDLFISY